MTITPSTVAAFLRTWGSLAAIVVSAIPQVGLPNAVRAVLIAGGAVIQAVDHWASTQPSAQATKSPLPPPG
ncbi:MAG TPA: hypothetical protein VK386_08945 [Acidimicrobiales bacterium]|nr:hypothetical protein [Acidimicrobiales bacterium]